MVYTTHLHKYGYISRYLVPSVESPMMAKTAGFDGILIDMEHSSFDLDEIAALDGVDSLLIGTNDLTAEMGIPGDYENPRVTEAYQRTINACQKVGKWVGVGGLHSRLDLVDKFCAMGANWVMAATDGPLLLGGATKRAGEMAVLNSKVVATRQASTKLAGVSNDATAVPEKLSEGLTANGSSINGAVH
jgi:2-keto-3-deoxy-L-rhamnonate aldolase RhmA